MFINYNKKKSVHDLHHCHRHTDCQACTIKSLQPFISDSQLLEHNFSSSISPLSLPFEQVDNAVKTFCSLIRTRWQALQVVRAPQIHFALCLQFISLHQDSGSDQTKLLTCLGHRRKSKNNLGGIFPQNHFLRVLEEQQLHYYWHSISKNWSRTYSFLGKLEQVE